jgi:hypothetical protein
LPSANYDVAGGFFDYYAPGDSFLGEPLTVDLSEKDGWEPIEQQSIEFGWNLSLEMKHVGRESPFSALVFMAHDGSHPEVIAALSADGPIFLEQVWKREDCPMAILILKTVLTTRSYYDEPGNEDSLVGGGDIPCWIAIGVASDRAWIASEELVQAPPTLQAREGWPELHVTEWEDGCTGSEDECLAQHVLELRRDTLRFERTGK